MHRLDVDAAFGDRQWSPDGTKIAVEALNDLWLVSVPSGTVQRLTNTPNIVETGPTWSPDGQWLAHGKGPGTYDPELPAPRLTR